ncbi:Solute carrier family 66 member 2 [Lamellibrachia satsuma]|nr:Solute carrier family 66 member 2 [Lamellibrachia satsuma]
MELSRLTSYFKSIPVSDDMLANIISWAAAMLMMFGGIVPFIPQYLDIKWTNNAEGFSTYVCLTLLIANILRIFFWFGHPFELPLLAQSFVMITAMLGMVKLCVSVHHRSELISFNSRTFTELRRHHFWQWTDFKSYVQFLLVFVAVVGGLTYFLLDWSLYVEILGFLALVTEAVLPAPQFYRNMMTQTTQGMSVKMVIMWTTGDIFKTVYFVVRQAPVQFWMCGIIQISLDTAILCQVFYYATEKLS